MEIIYLDTKKQIQFDKPIAAAIGFFDGIHQGHLKLVDKAKEVAIKNNYYSAMITFSPNPLVTLGVMKEERYLTSLKDRADILEALHIDYLFVIRFNEEVATMLPQDFINQYIISYHIKHLVCGFDFRFGAKGIGNGETLKQLSNNQYQVDVISQISSHDQKISSTYIQELLMQGNIEEANYLLSRPYKITGTVVHGKKVGTKIGFPTANIDYNQYILPKNGVYAVRIKYENNIYIGMCNIGYNPTISMLEKPSMEVHIYDFDKDIYDQEIEILFYQYIRAEHKFNDLNALKRQLELDEKEVRIFFGKK